MSNESTPATASTVTASVIGLAAVLLILRELSGLQFSILAGIGGVLCLALGIQLSTGRIDPGKSALISLLTLPVAVGFIGGMLSAALLLTGRYFPVPDQAAVSVGTLRILGDLGVVLGCTVAVFGLFLGYRNVLIDEALSRYTRIAFLTAAIPFAAGLVLFARIALSAAENTGLLGQVNHSVTMLYSPNTMHLHLSSFLFVLCVTFGALVLFLRRTPVAELFGAGTARSYRAADQLRAGVQVLTGLATAVLLLAVGIELSVGPVALQQQLGAVGDVIQLITTAGSLRLALLGITAVSLGVVCVQYLVREREAEQSESESLLAPIAVGLVLTVLVWTTADRLFERFLRETTTRLPNTVAAEFQSQLIPVANLYGEQAIVVLFLGVLMILTACLGLFLRSAVHMGYLSNEGTGYAIAAVGILFATVAMTIGDAPNWLVIGGVVAALVVWDTGRFGTRVDRELGGGAFSIEFVHATSTLIVGLIAVAVVFGIQTVSNGFVTASPTVTLALVSLIGGLLAFSFALRESTVLGYVR